MTTINELMQCCIQNGLSVKISSHGLNDMVYIEIEKGGCSDSRSLHLEEIKSGDHSISHTLSRMLDKINAQ